jgi:hypothetical protein
MLGAPSTFEAYPDYRLDVGARSVQPVELRIP